MRAAQDVADTLILETDLALNPITNQQQPIRYQNPDTTSYTPSYHAQFLGDSKRKLPYGAKSVFVDISMNTNKIIALPTFIHPSVLVLASSSFELTTLYFDSAFSILAPNITIDIQLPRIDGGDFGSISPATAHHQLRPGQRKAHASFACDRPQPSWHDYGQKNDGDEACLN